VLFDRTDEDAEVALRQRRRRDLGEHRDERVRIRRAFAGTRCQERLDGVGEGCGGVRSSHVKTLVATVARAVEGLHVIVAVERPVPRKALVEQHAE
jgi:hypothetical protein